MKIMLIDNSIEGLLSALYISFTEKIFPDLVQDKKFYQPQIGSVSIDVPTVISDSNRVKTALYKYGGCDIICHIKICIKSCDSKALSTAFFYAHKTLQLRKDISENLGEKCVSDFSFTVQKVLHERHILTGFLRFFESENGVLYSAFSPDNDVTELLAPHFLRRLGKIPFIIHDVKRGIVCISDGKNLSIEVTDKKAQFTASEREKEINLLWRKYYKNINIKERKNLRQQDNFIPRRYKKFAFETWE